MRTIYEIFKEKIRHARIDKKMKNGDIAKVTGLSKATIEAFMCGARESEKTAKKIATALDIEL